MSFTDISIDLETLGTKPGSVITQIGLCAFHRRPQSGGENTKSSINIMVNPQSSLDFGLKIDWPTVSWWLQQNEEARVQMAQQKGRTLDTALFSVTDWLRHHAPAGDPKQLCLWGHGCGFDVTMLEMAYYAARQTPPWDFRKVRDLRTLLDTVGAWDTVRPEPNVAHDAMEDATAQAEWIIRLTRSVEKRNIYTNVEQPHG